jgi:transcription elongation GreA/GreB family factor
MTTGHDERHALLDELALLRRRRRGIEESLEIDDPPHDGGERSEMTLRRDELDWIDRRIRDLTHLLRATAVDRSSSPDRVGVGAAVTLRYDDGTVETVVITAVPDEDVPSVTLNSALGRALLGARVGEEITWVAPEGRLRARAEDIGAPAVKSQPWVSER